MVTKADPIKCGPRPRLRKWRDLPNDKLTRAERVMRFIEGVLRVPEGPLVDQPIVLAAFQERFIRAVYDNPHGTRRAYLSKARKNSKTATIACLLLAHLVGPEAKLNSRIQSGAQSRKQAGEVFNYARKMVALSPELQDIVRVVPSYKQLVGLPLNVEYEAMSAEAKTAQGGSPILAILDEVGQVRGPQNDFIDAIETSQGAHDNPLLIAISTQAASDADLFSTWLDDAEQSQDRHIVSHLYTADKDCDLMDTTAWKDANPALGLFRSRTDLEEQAKQAARMPSRENTFRNLCLNQRVSTLATFVSVNVWKSCGGRVLDFGDTPVYAGLDLSKRTDLTAFVLVGKIAGVWHVRPYFWTPEEGLIERSKRDRAPYDVWVKQGYLQTTPGQTVDYEFVAQDIATICADLNLKVIAFDRWKIDQLKKQFEEMDIDTGEDGDLPMFQFGQGYKDMAPAIDFLEGELLNARLAHGNHPVLTMCAANAVTSKDPAENRKFAKDKATGRIDGMVALAMAVGVAQLNTEEPEKEHQMFFI